ncbi:MAG: VCBS repeat-containing protein [Pseudomonadota bacterium]
MLIRRFAALIIALFAILLAAAPALAQSTKKFTVFPFTYTGPQKYSYFPQAFQSSLSSSLEWGGHVVPAGMAAIEGISTPRSKADMVNALRTTGLDYVVTGTISILDNEATLSMMAMGADGGYWENKGQMNINQVTSWLDAQSKSVMGDVFRRPGYSASETAAKTTDIQDGVSNPTEAVNTQFLMAQDDQYQPDTLNPQFRYEGGAETEGRWRSQTLRFFSTSMVVADGSGDGQNEVFILHRTGIGAYRYEDGKLRQLDSLDLTASTQYLRLEAADLDRDGVPELIIGTYQTQSRSGLLAADGWPKSHILSFKGGKFQFVVKDYGRFLGVLRMPPGYTPILVAQEKGVRHLFSQRINEAYLKGNSIELGQSIPSPEFGTIYSMAYLPDEFGFKYVVLDDSHRIKVYSQTMERLSSTDEETYNSSGLGIDTSDRPLGMGPGTVDGVISTYNVPFRMVVASLSQKGKYELLVNRDLSVAAQVFERFNYYTQGEIHALTWDGVGMALSWKTRRIKGQVSDIAVADLNNDGNMQLCVLLNTFPGGMGFTNRQTVVLAYDLNTP